MDAENHQEALRASSSSSSEAGDTATAPSSGVDYINDYVDIDPNLPPPPPKDYKFEFEGSETSSTVEARPLAGMADLVAQEAQKSADKPASSTNSGENTPHLVNGEGEESGDRTHQIFLYVKAGSDRECIGCCPFSQRLFMMLWLKGVVFNVTTVDKATKPKQLKDIAAGANPPFLLFNGEELTDVQKCEDYIEAELYPPRYPKLACRHPTSNTVGMDVFAKFSALIKFTGQPTDPKRKMLEQRLCDALKKLNKYLVEPLDDEIDQDADDEDDEGQVSKRKFIDGDHMTIADCNLLPKLNIIRVAGRERIKFSIPDEFTGIHRYLANADATEEFSQTCPADGEIVWTYGGRKPRPQGWGK